MQVLQLFTRKRLYRSYGTHLTNSVSIRYRHLGQGISRRIALRLSRQRKAYAKENADYLFHAFRSLIRNQAKNKGMQKEAPTGLRPSHAFSSKAVKIQRQTAGLLTRSRRQTAFPGVSPVAKEWFATLIAWNSQQRDCSGLSPDSLLIGFHSIRTVAGAKIHRKSGNEKRYEN